MAEQGFPQADPQQPSAGASSRFSRSHIETEICSDPARRADRFVDRWRELDQASQRQYQAGDMSGYKTTQAAMAEMAKSLERDPQLESILANRKRDLGIEIKPGKREILTIPFKRPIKPVYIRKLVAFLRDQDHG